MEIAGSQFDTILIVDDSPEARSGYRFAIEDLHMEPVFQESRLGKPAELIRALTGQTAVVSDFRLRVGNYADYDGDTLVAECYKAHEPAILCTSYYSVDLRNKSRGLVRNIPVLIRSAAPTPEEIADGLITCVSEHKGTLSKTRKPWRLWSE